MTGWMLAVQAEPFGLEMDALTAEEAARLIDEASREAPLIELEAVPDDWEHAHEPSDGADEPTVDEWLSGSGRGAGGEVGGADRRRTRDALSDIDGALVPPARPYEFVCAGCFVIWRRGLLTDPQRRLCRDCLDDATPASHLGPRHP